MLLVLPISRYSPIRRVLVFRCEIALVGILVLLPATAGSTPVTSSPRVPLPPSGTLGCIHSAAVEALVAALGPVAAAQKDSRPEDLKRPMTDREIELLIRALEPVDIEKGKGRGKTIRAVAEGIDLSPARIRVLMDDILAVLARIHSREALADLKRAPDLPSAERARGVEWLNTIGRCAQFRFEGRGGGRIWRESERIVEKYRQKLESLILQAEPGEPLPK